MYKPAQQVFTTRVRQKIVEEPIIAIVSSEVFIPLVAEISLLIFPVVFGGRRVGESTTAVQQLWPLESPGRLAGAKAASGSTTRDQGGTTTRRPIRILNFHLDLPPAFLIWICTYEHLEYELVEHN